MTSSKLTSTNTRDLKRQQCKPLCSVLSCDLYQYSTNHRVIWLRIVFFLTQSNCVRVKRFTKLQVYKAWLLTSSSRYQVSDSVLRTNQKYLLPPRRSLPLSSVSQPLQMICWEDTRRKIIRFTTLHQSRRQHLCSHLVDSPEENERHILADKSIYRRTEEVEIIDRSKHSTYGIGSSICIWTNRDFDQREIKV